MRTVFVFYHKVKKADYISHNAIRERVRLTSHASRQVPKSIVQNKNNCCINFINNAKAGRMCKGIHILGNVTLDFISRFV